MILFAIALLAGLTGGPSPSSPEGASSSEADAGKREPPVDGLGTRKSSVPLNVGDGYEFPFGSEALALSEVLSRALTNNINLAITLAQVEVSEGMVLDAQGVYDVIITSGIGAQSSEMTPRGSAFAFTTGTRTLSAYLGIQRELETGGSLDLSFELSRSLNRQALDFSNPALASTTLAEYRVVPTLTLTHPLLRGMGVKVNRVPIERAQLLSSQSEAEAAFVARNLVSDIVSSYWDLLFASQDLGNKNGAIALGREQLARTRVHVKSGRLARLEIKAVQQSLAVREQEVLIAETAFLEASLRLRTLIGDDFSDHDLLGVNPTTDPDSFATQELDLNDAIERALSGSPQIQQFRLALASRRLDVLEAANQRLVQLDLSGSFAARGRSVDTLPDPTTGTPEQRGSWGQAFNNFLKEDVRQNGVFADFTASVQLDLTWDVQNKGAKGGHQRALVEIRKAELNLERLKQTTTTAIIQAVSRLRTGEKRLEVARISVEMAEQNIMVEHARFEAGRSTNYSVLQRIDTLAKAQTSALLARVDYLKARAQFQALTGEILPAYGLKLQGNYSPNSPL